MTIPEQNYPRDQYSNDTMYLQDINTTDIEDINFEQLPQSRNVSVFICIPSKGYERFFRTYIPLFDILLVAAIPFLLICSSNIGIIVFTMQKNRQMRQHRKRAHRRHQRLTIMLLSVTLAFIGLTCPSVILICANKIIQSKHLTRSEVSSNLTKLTGSGQGSRVSLIIEVCEALWYTKHAMNFILYTMSGQDFRREFIKLFTQCCYRRSPVLKTAVRQNAAHAETTADSPLIEIPIVNNANNKKKKRTSNPTEITPMPSVSPKIPA